jgi:hypothetical protein
MAKVVVRKSNSKLRNIEKLSFFLRVVLTQFCLFFYKSYQDEVPLASLPLLGYTVGPPGIQDAVQKDFVFKLSFKNHTYFFRAESEISYDRWLDNLKGICNQKYIRS